MWVSTDDGPDHGDDDWNLENLHAHLKMESLSEWLVTLRGNSLELIQICSGKMFLKCVKI